MKYLLFFAAIFLTHVSRAQSDNNAISDTVRVIFNTIDSAGNPVLNMRGYGVGTRIATIDPYNGDQVFTWRWKTILAPDKRTKVQVAKKIRVDN